jgi:hypothetical protein
MSPDSLMAIVNGRSMKQETLDAAPGSRIPVLQGMEYVKAAASPARSRLARRRFARVR